MNIDIRKNIYDSLKDEDETSLLSIINDSVVKNDELVLPGLGIILELIWKDLNDETKKEIVSILKNKLQSI